MVWVVLVSWLVLLAGSEAFAQPTLAPARARNLAAADPAAQPSPLPPDVSIRGVIAPVAGVGPIAGQSGRPELRIDGKTVAQAGPLELVWDKSANRFVGMFDVHNTGTAAFTVTRVAFRQSDKGPAEPEGIAVSMGKPGVALTIPPEESRPVTVTWTRGESSLKELYGHVVVETNVAKTNEVNPVLAMGIHAELPLGGVPWIFNHILSWLTFLPLLGMLAVFVLHMVGFKKDEYLKWGALGLMGLELAGAAWLYKAFDGTVGRLDGNDGFQFIERAVWIRSLNVEYFVGVDGTSISMVLLTAIVSFVAVLASFSVKTQLKGYWAMFMLLVTGMMGVFIALDLFLFYVFWEVMLLPMYFLIGIWGGPRKEYAAIKFFLYTLAGSVFMLLAFIALYYTSGPSYLVDGTSVQHTFAIPELMRVDFLLLGQPILTMPFTKVVWVVLFIAFAIKVPMVPFHTWLPDAHVEAPTAISVILAGVLLKMGVYGMLRLNFGLLPEATQWAAMTMAVFGVISILYGAFCAMAQQDLKRLVAYSSVSHMGFCLLGMAALTPHGIEAAIVQMFNHGTITAMLFALVGVIYDRAHTRDIGKFGGMAKEMPLYTAFFGFAFMASLGLPGLSGFIGEVLTFVGAFPVYPALTILAATGVIFSAAYHLWAMQRIFLGKFRDSWRESHALEPIGGRFPDINLREVATLVPVALLVLILGFCPRYLLDLLGAGVLDITSLVNPPGPGQISLHTDTARQLLALLP